MALGHGLIGDDQIMYYPLVTQATPLAVIKRERLLPMRGEVLVSIGARVESIDVVARTSSGGELHVVDVGKTLSVKSEDLDKYLLKALGDTVEEGEAIAAKGGGLIPLRRVCRSPVAGRIVAIDSGWVVLESRAETFELNALLKGTVVSVMPSLGVVIQTRGALVQGVWGAGGEAQGVLKMVAEDRKEKLVAEAIDVGCHGAIIVGGSSVDEEALQQAEQMQVRGIVVGSIGADLEEQASDFPCPVVATEGMGQVPMASVIFELLRANGGREASISSTTRFRWGAVRPEIIIPSQERETISTLHQSEDALEVGAQVRVIRQPYLGSVGEVISLPSQARAIDSGARLRGAEVELEEKGRVFIPYANLELIG
jgi:hypothetical protein